MLCQQEHLFKRSILLAKCWCACQRILNNTASTIAPIARSDEQTPLDGLLSGMFVRTLMLFIFNLRAPEIATPLEALFRLLEFLKDFDWDEHALTAYGAVTLVSLEQHGPQGMSRWEYLQRGPCAWPPQVKPFLSREMWRQYQLTPKEARNGRLPTAPRHSFSSSGSHLSSAPARSNSDSHLATLPLRGSQPNLAQINSQQASKNALSPNMRAVNVHPPSQRLHSQSITVETIDPWHAPPAQFNGGVPLHPLQKDSRRPFSQSFNAIDSLEALTPPRTSFSAGVAACATRLTRTPSAISPISSSTQR